MATLSAQTTISESERSEGIQETLQLCESERSEGIQETLQLCESERSKGIQETLQLCAKTKVKDLHGAQIFPASFSPRLVWGKGRSPHDHVMESRHNNCICFLLLKEEPVPASDVFCRTVLLEVLEFKAEVFLPHLLGPRV